MTPTAGARTWLEVGALRLEASWIGAPAPRAPVLVFLHEGLGSITQWRDTPAIIAARTQLPALIYAREGYGHSTPVKLPRPLTYMHDEAARLPAVLAAAGVAPDRAVLIGHSDGASIALIAAATCVAPVAIVAIAPHVFTEAMGIAAIAAAARDYASATTELRAKLARHHADVDGAFHGWAGAWLAPEFRRWNLEPLLPCVRAPTLLVQGSADAYGTRAQLDAISRQLGAPCTTAWIEGAGHAPFRDRPDEVHTAIVDFVRSHANISG